MKTEENGQTQQTRLSEGMRLIFDQESLSSSSSSRRSSSQDSSYSSSRGRKSSYKSRRTHRRRQDRHRSRSSSSSSSSSSSTSNSDSSSGSRSRTRSRSHPRCHRASDTSRCRHRCRSPPRRYRARSRSYSPSPDRWLHRGRRHRAYSRSRSRSPSHERFSRRSYRSRSRSSSCRASRSRFVGRYRCRFSPSPKRRSYRDYRSRSKSLERSTVRLSQKEKVELLNIAKENASKILGVHNLELPASVKIVEQQEKKPDLNTKEEVRGDPVPLNKPAQDKDVTNEDDHVVRTSPTRKPITFSIYNTVAKPSSSPTFHVTESKVTSRADSVGNRKPYGQWVPVKKSSSNKH